MSNPFRVAETAMRPINPVLPTAARLPNGMSISGPGAEAMALVLNDAARLSPAPSRAAPDGGTTARASGVDPTELALDLGQIALDVVGIFEPTPFADGANTLISWGRGDLWGGLISAAGMIPYLGDAAKLGKMGKWAKTVANAVELAASSPALARTLEPGLKAIKEAVDAIPQGAIDALPKSARDAILSMKSKLDDFFAKGADDATGASRMRSMDELLPGGKVPSVRGGAFNKWFDDLSPQELRELWKNKEIRETIGDRIRQPGGLHEWYMVKHTPEFKDLGISMDEIKHFRSKIADLKWTNPVTGKPGGHGGHGSRTFHDELSNVIQSSGSLSEVNRGIDRLLQRWKIDPDVLPDLGG